MVLLPQISRVSKVLLPLVVASTLVWPSSKVQEVKRYVSGVVYFVLFQAWQEEVSADMIEENENTLRKLKHVSERIFEVAEKKYWQNQWHERWEIYMLDSDEDQILSIGKKLYVCKGLIQRIDVDQLAFLVGHEVWHKVRHHDVLAKSFPFDFKLRERMELEADELWVFLAKQAWFKPEGMITFLTQTPYISDEKKMLWYPTDTTRIERGKKIIASM